LKKENNIVSPERVELVIYFIFNHFMAVFWSFPISVGFTHGYLDSVLSGLFVLL